MTSWHYNSLEINPHLNLKNLFKFKFLWFQNIVVMFHMESQFFKLILSIKNANKIAQN